MGWPGPMTHRQFEAWLAWVELDNDEVDKLTAYLMSIATEVRRGYVKDARSVDLKHLKLPFGRPGKKKALTEEEKKTLSEEIKKRAVARAGGKVQVRTVKAPPKEEQ